MNLEQIAADVSRSPQVGDEHLANYARELLEAGESEMAVATLLECAPDAFPRELIDQLEADLSGSGAWGESAILQAIEQYRARARAA